MTALGMGLFASESSALDAPVAPSIDPLAAQSTPTASLPPLPSTKTRDAAARRASTSPSAQAPGIGVYTALASGQGGATGSGQGGPGMGAGGMYGNGPYSGYEPIGGSGTTTPGMAGATAPGADGAAAPGAAPTAANPAQDALFGGGGAGAGGGDAAETPGVGNISSNFLPNVIGDMGPGVRTSVAPISPTAPPSPTSPRTPPQRSSVTSIIRVFKISENQSPRPQDRVFFTFNYFNNVDKSVNNLDSSPIKSINIYRYVWGFEKTFDEGRGSIGLSLPLYSQFSKHLPGSGVTTNGGTSLGDLNIFAKYILKENKETGSLLSTGLLLTPPTGPRYLGGANYFPQSNPAFKGSFTPVHDLQIQPFVGYIFQRDRFFIQGFSALNVPVSPEDVTFWFNDVQFGYILFRDRESDRLVTAITPTFEAHISNPLNHRGVQSKDPYNNFQYDPYGTADTVNLTYGINFEIRRNSLLTLAFAEPVTSYKPFAYEAFVLFNYRFGRSRALVNPPPNVVGG